VVRPLPLARSVVDRAAHRRRDEAWLAEAWQRAQVLVVDTAAGGAALLDEEGELVLRAPLAADADPMFLGVDADGAVFFAVEGPVVAAGALRPVTLREAGRDLSERDADLLATAAALAFWHRRHRFSATGGELTTPVESGWSRRSPEGRQEWPRTDPAVIMLVHDGRPGPDGRCLLAVGAEWDSQQMRRYSCLAGFVEAGESAESAVAREVAEEVGVVVHDIRYVASQPWPFPASLMLGFTAVADPAAALRLDQTEIARAQWFSRRDVATVRAGGRLTGDDGVPVGFTDNASISASLIDRWLAEQ